MEKVKKYQKALLQILKEFADIRSPFMPEVENEVITDTKNHHYQLQRIGWYKDRHVHYTVFHFDIVNGKVQIRENRTDVNIEEELVAAGISQKDIVSGLQNPALKALVESVPIKQGVNQ